MHECMFLTLFLLLWKGRGVCISFKKWTVKGYHIIIYLTMYRVGKQFIYEILMVVFFKTYKENFIDFILLKNLLYFYTSMYVRRSLSSLWKISTVKDWEMVNTKDKVIFSVAILKLRGNFLWYFVTSHYYMSGV